MIVLSDVGVAGTRDPNDASHLVLRNRDRLQEHSRHKGIRILIRMGCQGRSHLFGAAEKAYNMSKKNPWHSIKQNVYHDDTNCNSGNNIEKENLRDGTGGKPKCNECKSLDK